MSTLFITFSYLSYYVKVRFPLRLRQGTRGGGAFMVRRINSPVPGCNEEVWPHVNVRKWARFHI